MNLLRIIHFWKRKLVMISGAGASMSFQYPSTQKFTNLIETALRSNPSLSSADISLYDEIVNSLRSYLLNPGIFTFEDIYQAIQDLRTIQSIPTDPSAFDEFRPRVGATHTLKKQFLSFSDLQGRKLQNAYLDDLLDVFLSALSSVSGLQKLSDGLQYLEKKFIVWSFTLNYDPFLDDVWNHFITGFIPGNAPRSFKPNLLFSALKSYHSIHSHLHGSLKWGFPTTPGTSVFDIHEFENPQDGVQNSKSRPSGRPAQKGEALLSSPVITGLDKTELVFREPFFTNFATFFSALDLCTDLLIAGYGFSDRHVNMGIQQCRRYRPNVKTYIVDKNNSDDPEDYFDQLTPDAWHTVLPGDAIQSTKLPSGWWKIPGITSMSKSFSTSPIYLWLKGFDTFCESIKRDGFPK